MAIETEITKKLNQAEFQVGTTLPVDDIPEDFYPNMVTSDGELLIFITGDDDDPENLFEAVGRTAALREYLDQNDLKHKYSVNLIILLEQYKKLKKEIRQVLNQRIPLIILE